MILDFPNTESFKVGIKDDVIGFGTTITSFIPDISLPPSSMFLKVFHKNELPKFKGTNIAIEKIRIPKTQVWERNLCEENFYSFQMENVKLKIKNLGPNTVDE